MPNHASIGDKCQITECTAACTSSPPLVMGKYCCYKAWTFVIFLMNRGTEQAAEHRSGTLFVFETSGRGFSSNMVLVMDREDGVMCDGLGERDRERVSVCVCVCVRVKQRCGRFAPWLKKITSWSPYWACSVEDEMRWRLSRTLHLSRLNVWHQFKIKRSQILKYSTSLGF